VVPGTGLVRAIALLVEAAAPVVSPVTFLVSCALQTVAIIFGEEASARAFVPSAFHSTRALLLHALALIQLTKAVTAEQLRRLVG